MSTSFQSTTHSPPPRYGGLLGVGGAVLALGGTAMMATTDFMAPTDEIVVSAVDNSTRIVAGAQVAAIGFILLAAFGAVLARRIADVAPRSALGTMAVSGFVATAVSGLTAIAAMAALALRSDEDGTIAPASATALADLGTVLLGGAAPVCLALGVGATAAAALKHRMVIPRWLAMAGAVLAVGLLVLPINYLVAPVALLWTIAVGVTLSWNPQSAPVSQAEAGQADAATPVRV